MYKIYSRHRYRLPKFKFNYNKNKKKIKPQIKRKITTIIIIILIAISTVKLIWDAVLPIFDTLCKDKAKSIATIVSNEEATNVMKEHSYDELFTIERDQSGNITMIRSNVVPINEIISDIPNKIQEQINEKGITVIVSTHDRDIVDYFRKRVITMEQGQIIRDVQAGTYE